MELIKRSRVLLLLFIAGACIEPYDPPVDNKDVRFLVIDAFLNASDGSATVKITRTLPVESIETIPDASGASVSIEAENGPIYQLTETASGMYTGSVTQIDLGRRYRLLVQADDKDSYASDFIYLQRTPPIESITYAMVRDGLQLRVTSRDETGQYNHYRWRYWETYEYTSNFNSAYIVIGDTIDLRPVELSIYTCWRTLPSTGILVASTKSLTEPVVSNFPLLMIPRGSRKIMQKYSLLVQQQALTPEGYNYWLNLQKTTEQLGGLFDPLPSEVQGNIRCTSNPGKTVIGFFGGGSLEEKRIFIKALDLPDEMLTYRYPYCELDSLDLEQVPFFTESTLLVDAIIVPIQGLIGYTTAPRGCIDCTVGGGVAQKPDFWE
jgi:hypothetical protein